MLSIGKASFILLPNFKLVTSGKLYSPLRKFIRIVILCLSVSFSIKAQTLQKPLQSSYTGLGAYSSGHTDIFSFTNNQASLAGLKNFSAGVFGERRFMLNELNHYMAVAGMPTHSGNFGLKATYSGFTDYNETQLGLAYARKLGKKVDIGAQFNYNGIRIAGYGNASAISFELGSILHITEKLHAGVQVNNPVGGKFGKEQEKLPSVYSFGLGYEASNKFLLTAEVEKEENQPINVNTGFQYRFIPQLQVRAGVSSAASIVWAGVGVRLNAVRIDITSSYHPQLGVTPGLLLLFGINKDKE
jgi:hypothetical protein